MELRVPILSDIYTFVTQLLCSCFNHSRSTIMPYNYVFYFRKTKIIKLYYQRHPHPQFRPQTIKFLSRLRNNFLGMYQQYSKLQLCVKLILNVRNFTSMYFHVNKKKYSASPLQQIFMLLVSYER